MLATYHTHTRWSDGKATAAQLLEAARTMRIDELGFSDHFVLHPGGAAMKWAMPTDALPDYVSDIRHLAARTREHGGPTIRLGLEVDWFPGHEAALRAALDPYPFDYIIGSVHDVDGMLVDMSAAAWEKLDASQRNRVHRQYWINMRSLAESGLFDIAAHLDLTKKFGCLPTIDLSKERHTALDAIADAGLVVELNTAGWHKPCDDAYPRLDILRECHDRGIPVTLSSDAHQPDHLLRDFARGAQRLMEAGYAEVARFAGRTRTFEPIESAIAGL